MISEGLCETGVRPLKTGVMTAESSVLPSQEKIHFQMY